MLTGFGTFLLALAAAHAVHPLPFTAMAQAVSPSAIIEKVNIFSSDGNDPRQMQGHAGADKVFAPIGRILTNQRVPNPGYEAAAGSQRGVNLDSTAFLVSPCYALTNYHAVFGGSRIPSRAYTATLYTFDGDGTSMSGTNATPVIWGSMARSPQPANDWVLLKLDDCVGARVGWMEIANLDAHGLLQQDVVSVGFASDKDTSSLWSDACHLRHAGVGDFLDDCAIVEGASGSPIMVLNAGHPEVVALNQGEFNASASILPDYTSQRANVAGDINTIDRAIAHLIRDDIAAFGQPNPATSPAEQ